ncbi:MAG TPA: TIGR03009 domain-containing protein [Gemmataceae bacterium]|nr:TIGR03009 domain-containing protein [Gemmataceae bacterium]
MRPRGLALIALLLAAAPLAAQQPNTPAAPPAPTTPGAQPADPLDAYLTQWQQTMEGVQALSATLKRTEKDQTTGTEKHLTGFTKYLHVSSGGTTQNLALLQMTEDGQSDFAQRFVCSGAFLYEFQPLDKKIVAHEIPKPKAGQVSDDNFMSFLFGMKKDDAKARYELKLDHTDDDYAYIMITPRFAADKVDFKRAQIVICKDTAKTRSVGIAGFPRRLWFESPNSTETTWDVLQINNNDKTIDRREFDAPQPAPGWKMVAAPKDEEPQPRVVRPSGN